MLTTLLEPELIRRLNYLRLVIPRTHSPLVGTRVSRKSGTGMDFSGYRKYQQGDDYRYIDWNLLARQDQPFLKEFVEDRDARVCFLIDQSESMGAGSPTKFRLARSIAAALGYVALRQYDRVGAVYFARQLERILLPKKGGAHTMRLFHFLSETQLAGPTAFSYSLHQFAHRFGRSGLAIVLSDLLDPQGYQAGLLSLQSVGWDIMLIQVMGREDLEAPQDEDITLVDIETDQRLDVGSTEADAYTSRLNRFLADVSTFCTKRRIRYVLTCTQDSLDDVLFGMLPDRGGVR